MAKIMVVEDSRHQRDFLATALRRDGHDVVTAENGSQALERLAAENFELILTDIFMPDCDGLELIRRIRAHDNRLPLIAMSAGKRGDLFLRVAETFGADAVLSKDEPPADIAATVAQVLARQTVETAAFRDRA